VVQASARLILIALALLVPASRSADILHDFGKVIIIDCSDLRDSVALSPALRSLESAQSGQEIRT
jgi:hypothetical protein